MIMSHLGKLLSCKSDMTQVTPLFILAMTGVILGDFDGFKI